MDLRLNPGVRLFTRHGRRTGNGIIVNEAKTDLESLKRYLENTDQRFWCVETDYGNRMNLSDNEINEMFVIGPQDDYIKWSTERDNLRNRTLKES